MEWTVWYYYIMIAVAAAVWWSEDEAHGGQEREEVSNDPVFASLRLAATASWPQHPQPAQDVAFRSIRDTHDLRRLHGGRDAVATMSSQPIIVLTLNGYLHIYVCMYVLGFETFSRKACWAFCQLWRLWRIWKGFLFEEDMMRFLYFMYCSILSYI